MADGDPTRALRVALRLAGAVVASGGVAHSVAVVLRARGEAGLEGTGPRYELFLAFIGVTQLAMGLLDWIAAGCLEESPRTARRVCGVSLLLAVAFAGITYVSTMESPLLFRLAGPVYLVAHVALLVGALRAGPVEPGRSGLG